MREKRRLRGPLIVDRPCDAEVDDLRMTAGVDEDVGGLEIPVSDAALVGVGYSISHRGEQLEMSGYRAPCLLHPFVERPPFDEIHGKERNGAASGLCSPGLEDLCNAGVAQPTEERGDLKAT